MRIDATKPEGFQAWVRACGFGTDEEAYASMGWNYRTYYRYKAKGIPGRALGEAVKAQMAQALDAWRTDRKEQEVRRAAIKKQLAKQKEAARRAAKRNITKH